MKDIIKKIFLYGMSVYGMSVCYYEQTKEKYYQKDIPLGIKSDALPIKKKADTNEA